MKIRALRVSFRAAVESVQDLDTLERGRQIASIVQRGREILSEIRREAVTDAASVDAAESEIDEVARQAGQR